MLRVGVKKEFGLQKSVLATGIDLIWAAKPSVRQSL